MSRLIELLERVSQGTPQPMGFIVGHPASQKGKMLVIASFREASIDHLASQMAGADGAILHLPSAPADDIIKGVSKAIPQIPWGCWLEGDSPKGLEQVMKLGCDFVAFPATSSLAIPKGDKLGRIIQVEASLDVSLVETINDLPVDAVLVDTKDEKQPLTWNHVMLLRCFASLLAKPLLASLPVKATADELQALWESGVNGIIADVEPGQPVDMVKQLRQAINKLTLPSPHKLRKMGPLLPRIAAEAGGMMEEEEEE